MNTTNKASTAGQAAALAPIELLQALSGWMDASGFDAAHPWQVAIAATLSQHPAMADAARQRMVLDDAATLFYGVAESCDDLTILLQEAIGGRLHVLGGAMALARQIGWLSDQVAQCGRPAGQYRGDANVWLLPVDLENALANVQGHGAAKGGAA